MTTNREKQKYPKVTLHGCPSHTIAAMEMPGTRTWFQPSDSEVTELTLLSTPESRAHSQTVLRLSSL